MSNTPEKPLHEHAALIETLGGPAALARRLGFKGDFGTQRVNNWRFRGIPSSVWLHNLDLFGPVPSSKEAA